MARLQSFAVLLITIFALFIWNIEAALPHSNVDPFMEQKQGQYGEGSLRPSECGQRCSYRCSATSHKKPCMFFCQKCCAKCLCVPPGTFGNKQVCPCYNNWKTQQGGPKCP
uniref:GASA5-like protein n=1 Tax=Picea mariana TaxID=3335 RepID=O65066_PICMA|nr:GASA5-like protein [Picea mariana]